MKQKRKAKISEIKEWYIFKPTFDLWFTKRKEHSYIHKMPQESWYGGYWFNSGYFAFIQCKLFAIHIKLIWWNSKF